MVIDEETGTIVWQPTANQIGDTTVRVQATDIYYVATLAAALYTASAIAEYLTAEIAVTASLTKGFI
jgi:hypothetical protein